MIFVTVNKDLMRSFAQDALKSLNLNYPFLFRWVDQLHQTLLAQNSSSIPKGHLEKIVERKSGQFAAIGSILVHEQIQDFPSFGLKAKKQMPPPLPRKPSVKDILHQAQNHQ